MLKYPAQVVEALKETPIDARLLIELRKPKLATNSFLRRFTDSPVPLRANRVLWEPNENLQLHQISFSGRSDVLTRNRLIMLLVDTGNAWDLLSMKDWRNTQIRVLVLYGRGSNGLQYFRGYMTGLSRNHTPDNALIRTEFGNVFATTDPVRPFYLSRAAQRQRNPSDTRLDRIGVLKEATWGNRTG